MQEKKIGRIEIPRIIRIGGGVYKETGDILEQLDLSRPLIVTDKNLTKIGHTSKLTDILDGCRIKWGIFDKTIEDPTDTCLIDGIKEFKKQNYDCVIGFGGGSSMDLAKAISAMSANPGHVRDYKAPAQVNKTGVPIILLPTTGGTGAELTRWCVITDTKRTEKYNLCGLAFVATAALIDWQFTITKPSRLTADTAIDSLTHAIESYVGRKSFPLTETLALAAMSLIAKNVKRAYNDPKDSEAREALMIGASKAGIAFSNSSVALVHGMSRPLGAYFHFAHGLSNAMLLPAVTEFSIKGSRSRYSVCAKAIGWATEKDSENLACQKLIEGLHKLNYDLNVPSPSEQGLSKIEYLQKIPTMATQAINSGSPQNNPRIPSVEQIIELYKKIW